MYLSCLWLVRNLFKTCSYCASVVLFFFLYIGVFLPSFLRLMQMFELTVVGEQVLYSFLFCNLRSYSVIVGLRIRSLVFFEKINE